MCFGVNEVRSSFEGTTSSSPEPFHLVAGTRITRPTVSASLSLRRSQPGQTQLQVTATQKLLRLAGFDLADPLSFRHCPFAEAL